MDGVGDGVQKVGLAQAGFPVHGLPPSFSFQRLPGFSCHGEIGPWFHGPVDFPSEQSIKNQFIISDSLFFWQAGVSFAVGGGCSMTHAVGTAGNLGLPAGAPFLGKKWGKEPQREEVLPSGLPSLVELCGGGCTSYRIPGLRPSQRKARSGPPTGWAGWGRGQVPFGKKEEKNHFVSHFFPPVNEPLLPPARAGGRAMRRWSWRPQARPLPDQLPSPIPPTREWGSKEGTSFPLVFFPPISSKK